MTPGEKTMTNASLKIAFRVAGGCLGACAGFGVTFAFAGLAAPAPVVGIVGGPVGFAAAGVAFGGYLLFKHLRDRR
jgi:hypothetical protein